jgi:hypothetical protein
MNDLSNKKAPIDLGEEARLMMEAMKRFKAMLDDREFLSQVNPDLVADGLAEIQYELALAAARTNSAAQAASLGPDKTAQAIFMLVEYLAETAAPEDIKAAAKRVHEWIGDRPFNVRVKLEESPSSQAGRRQQKRSDQITSAVTTRVLHFYFGEARAAPRQRGGSFRCFRRLEDSPG